MKLRTTILAVVVVLIVSALNNTNVLADSAGTAWDHVNVALADSTFYEDVSLAWKLEGYSIELTNVDGERINISPSMITKITDRDGVDITNDVADSSPATDVKFSLLGDEKTISFQFKYMFLAGLSGALTNTDDSHKPLPAAFAATRLGLGERLHVSVFYRRQHIVESVSAGGGEFSSNAHEIHLMLGMRTTHPRRNNNYGYMEAGAIFIDFDRRFDNTSQSWTDDDTRDIGMVVQGGVVIPISEAFAVDLNGILEYRPSLISSGVESGFLIGLNVALAFFN